MSEQTYTQARARYASDELITVLRDVSRIMESSPQADNKTVFFPNWETPTDELMRDADNGEVFERATEETFRARSIRRAARAIYAEVLDYPAEGGRSVSKQDVAALIHYIADMMEE